MGLIRAASNAARAAGAERRAGAVDWFRLTRVHNAAIAGGYTLIGRYLAGAHFDVPWSYARPALVVLLAVCFGNVVNDLVDESTDAIAYPNRPIPSGAIARGTAVQAAFAFAVGAIALGASLGNVAMVVTVAMLGLAAAYSLCLKSTLLLGNVAVGVTVATTLLFGALAAGRVSSAVYAASAVTFVFVVAQEALFTLEDERADRAAGLRTTANRLGRDTAQLLVRFLFVAFALVSLSPLMLAATPRSYLFAAIPCMLGPTLWLLALLHRPATTVTLRRAARFSRLLWITGALPLLLLRP